MRRRPLAVALVAWTFFVWTTRIANIWRDEALTTGEKWGRTGLAVSFTVLALAVVVTLWRQARQASLVAVGALAGWSVVVWVVRDVRIVAADHGAGFKAVHTVLAVVSIALAAGLARARGAAPPAGAPAGDVGRRRRRCRRLSARRRRPRRPQRSRGSSRTSGARVRRHRRRP